jgi:hypothetical protein
MATARAIANGNWSATSTWNGGVLPGNGDTVYANGFNVTINQDINIGGANNPTVNAGSFVSGQWYEVLFVGTTSWTGIGAASNTAGTIFLASGVGSGTGEAKAIATLSTAANTAAGAAAGGSFVMSAVRAMTCDIRAGTTTCLNVTATSGTLTLSGLRVTGGSAAIAHGISAATSSDLASCILTGGNSSSAFALNNASTGTVNVSASCTFIGNGTNGFALNNASTGTVNVSASCTFTGGGASTGHALNNASTGTVNVSASCTFTGGASTGLGGGLNNASTGTVNVSASCTFTGSGVPALNNASTGTLIVTGSTFTASAFNTAVNIANTAADVRLSGDFLDHWSGFKAVSGSKWRLGTSPTLGQTRYALAGTIDSYYTMYGADNGSFGNPIAANVRSGISYGGGNITGTCAVPAAGSVSLGVPVDAGYGTAVLTPEAVWSHASRTITEGGITAADVWNAATRTITGGTVTTLTNAPTVPTAAAIATQVRSELSVELGRVDAAISSRAVPSDIPTESEIAAEVWAKPTTELTITGSIGERAKNQSTVSTTGAQLAAALS